jgi:hypothetical protein
MATRITLVDFIELAREAHGEVYDYSSVVWVNSITKIDIICPIHGTFTQNPQSHIRGTGCKRCGMLQRAANNLVKYGVTNPSQTKLVQDKTKATNLEKYGTEYAISSSVVRNRIKTTNLDRTGHENPLSSPLIRNKLKATNLEKYGHEHILISPHRKANNLEKYGCEYSSQSELVKDKIKATNLEKYGHENPFGSDLIKEQLKATNLEKYGTESHSQKHLLDILPQLTNLEWLIDQYATYSKTAWQISKELGISDVTVGKYLRRAEIEIKATRQTSYRSNQWLDSLGITNREYQWHPTNKRLKSDGYDPETNTIYEFHGDYWHGNPVVFASDKIFHGDLTFGELYQRTKLREEEILNLGYNLVVMWENDFI